MNIEQLVKKVEDAQTELLKVRKLVCELEAENTRLKIKSLVLPEDAKFDMTDEMKVVKVAANLPEPKIENRWILATERLPEKNKRVLLCDRCTVFVGKLGNEGYWIFEPTEIGMCTKQSDILAWMPLPEPYEE